MMTVRRTPEQIADEFHFDSPLAFVRDHLPEHGYVIVHPDDVPVKSTEWQGVQVDPSCREPMRADGWNACRAHIFGDDQ